MNQVKNVVTSEVTATPAFGNEGSPVTVAPSGNKKVTVFARKFLDNSDVLELTHVDGLILEVHQPAMTSYTKKVLAVALANILTATHASASLALNEDAQCTILADNITQAALYSMAEGEEPPSVAVVVAALAAISTKYNLNAWEAYGHVSMTSLVAKISNATSPLSVLEALKTSNPAIRAKLATWAKPTTTTVTVKEAVEFDY